MKLIAILFAVLALTFSVFACPLWSPSPPVTASTLAANNAVTAVSESGNITNALQRRAFVTKERGQPWPHDREIQADGSALSAILYCYANEEARHDLEADINDAIGYWLDALGGRTKSAKDTGHSLTFIAMGDTCYQNDYQNPSHPGTWNVPHVDHWELEKVLTIHKVASGGTSTVGYTPPEKNPQAGRHKLMVAPTKVPQNHPQYHIQLAPIIHELGHVLGLGHEHQRPDAAVRIICDKIAGHEFASRTCLSIIGSPTFSIPPPAGVDFKQWASEPDGWKKLGEFLCKPENRFWTILCSHDYNELGKEQGNQFETHGPYDMQSIMHYPTTVQRNGKLEYWLDGDDLFHDWEEEKQSAFLLGVRPDGSEFPVPYNTKITQGDVNAVKKMYPFPY